MTLRTLPGEARTMRAMAGAGWLEKDSVFHCEILRCFLNLHGETFAQRAQRRLELVQTEMVVAVEEAIHVGFGNAQAARQFGLAD